MSFEPYWSNYFCYCPSVLPNMFSSSARDKTKRKSSRRVDWKRKSTSSTTGIDTSRSLGSSSFDGDDYYLSSLSCAPTLLFGNAFDLILTQSSQESSLVACSDATFFFDKTASTGLKVASPWAQRVVLEIDTISGSTLRFPVINTKIQSPEAALYPMEERRAEGVEEYMQQENHCPLALSTIAASLEPGCNRARYLLLDDDDEVVSMAPINVFLWSDQDRVVVVDIDGTITKSNVRGVVDTVLTDQYQHVHGGVCKFFSSLLQLEAQRKGQTRLVYLSSRPIALANTTKKFLAELRQHEETQLPSGPLIGFPGTLAQVLVMELISYSVHEFKSSALRDQVVRPFASIGVTDNVLLAGFGNTLMDMEAYLQAGCERIYLIDKASKIYNLKSDELPAASSSSFSASSSSSSSFQRRSILRRSINQDSNKSLVQEGPLFHGYSDHKLLTHVFHADTLQEA